MIRRVVFAFVLSKVESVKLSQQAKLRGAEAGGVLQCQDTTKADEFYEALHDGIPANGKRVGEWRDMYPSWSFALYSDDSKCMLQGDEVKPDKSGVQVVIDVSTANDLHCCKEGERPSRSHQDFVEGVENHRINNTKFTFTIPESAVNPEKHYFYEVAVPESCQPGGKKAPCPLLVSLHGMALDHLPHMALECSDCMDDMGVVTALLYMPDAISHDEKGNIIANIVWDSALWVGEDFVRPVTQQVMKDYSQSIDDTRVYLFGLSMGGAGALMDGITMPDLFNEVYAVSPTSFQRISSGTVQKAKDEHWKSLYSKRKNGGAGTLQKIYVFSGNEDVNSADIDWDLVPQTLAAAGLEKEPLYVEYRMFPYPHDCWVAAFETFYDRLWKGD